MLIINWDLFNSIITVLLFNTVSNGKNNYFSDSINYSLMKTHVLTSRA